MNDERQEPISEEKKYTILDMLDAFYHGRNYEELNVKYDLDYSTVDEKHRPFYEWLNSREGK